MVADRFLRSSHTSVGVLFALTLAAPAACQREPRLEGWKHQRERLVDEWLVPAGIRDSATLAAMRTVPRHEFVPPDQRAYAYLDMPLPIGHDQTISQPAVVALMTELIAPRPGKRVLEVGTGSGYQAAVLAQTVAGSGPSRSSRHSRERQQPD